MCGIFGFLTRTTNDIPPHDVLIRMRDTLVHRGPDDSGEYLRPLDPQGPFVFLGHRRMSITERSISNASTECLPSPSGTRGNNASSSRGTAWERSLFITAY